MTLTQYRAMVQPDGTNPDGSEGVFLNNDLIGVTLTVTDGDNDQASTTVHLNGVVEFLDDGPTLLASSNLVYSNTANGAGGVGGTGIYHYSIGSDGRTSYDSTHSDFLPITLSGSVGPNAIQNASATWFSETSTAAVFHIAFDYQANPSDPTLTHDTGTLTFDKVDGTYTLVLDQPINSFTIIDTANGLSFVGYQPGTNTVDTTQPGVMVTEVTSSFWVQFTGDETKNPGTPHLLTSDNNTTFTNGELVHAVDSYVSVSGSSNGVAGDTIQSGEVLDFNFYASNPTGHLGNPSTAWASTMLLKFDGFSNGDDMVVILKLVDAGADGILGTGDDVHTTKALVVDTGDVFTAANPAPAGFGITLDNNDGAIIIESNDYNAAGQHYVIEGAQVLSSTDTLTDTTAINFNGTTGAGGASTGTEAFGGSTVDTDVLKISDIGFISTTTTTQSADLQFQVSNVDADGDTTSTQTLDVQVAGTTLMGTAGADVLQSSSGNDTMTGNGGNDLFVLQASGGGHDSIQDFLSGADQIVVDIAGQNLTIGTSTTVAAANFHTGDETQAATWNGGTNNEFVYNSTTHELWFSANGTGTDKVDLAHITTGVPIATDIHTY
jgi:hypothetical protein